MRLNESFRIVQRAKHGATEAREELCRYYLPHLRRWAHGRLPRGARQLIETEDIVQDVLHRTVSKLPELELEQVGAFQSYLRQAVKNRVRDEIRRAARGPLAKTYEERAAPTRSPLQRLIGRERLQRYERALEKIRPADRDAIVARLELGMSFAEVAETLGKSSPDAARMAVTRAVKNLLQEMSRARG